MLMAISVEELLEVLVLSRDARRQGLHTSKACRRAMHIVASRKNISYQTLANLCTDRIKLKRIADFHLLMEEWFHNNASGLLDTIVQNVHLTERDKVINFFQNPDSYIVRHGLSELIANPFVISTAITEATFTKLKYIAHLEEISLDILLNRAIENIIKERAEIVHKQNERRFYKYNTNNGIFYLFGQGPYNFYSWPDLMIRVCGILRERYPAFDIEIFDLASKTRYKKPYFSTELKDLAAGQGTELPGITPKLYVNTKLNSKTAISRCKRFIEHFGGNRQDLKVHPSTTY